MKIKRRMIYIIVGIAVFLFLFLNEGFRTMIQRYLEYNKLAAHLEQMKLQNSRLRKEIYLLENDVSYIEYTARKDLGLNSPGEIEYRFKK
ncbi:MAG: septum formation initiator family protein [Elusimicrobiota bacterium]